MRITLTYSRRRTTSVTVLALAASIVLANGAAPQAMASSWNASAGGSWSDSTKWTGVVPNSGVDADFARSASYTVTFDPNLNAAARNLTTATDGLTFSFGSAATLAVAGDLTVSGTSSLNGPGLTLNGGPVSLGGTTFVGSTNGTGRLTVGSGAALTNTTAGSMFSGYNGGNGTIELTGGTVSQKGTTYVGYYGGTGQMTVGSGSTFTSTGGGINVGYFSRTTPGDTNGTLTVSAGGTLTSTAAVTDSVIGGQGGVGTVSVTGTNASWTHRGNIYVGGTSSSGSPGVGSLSITNGGKLDVSSGTLKIWNTGSLTVSGTNSTLNVDSMDLGGNASNMHFTGGTVNLRTGTIGNFGGQTLSAGGTVTGTGTLGGAVAVPTSGKLAPGSSSAGGTLNVTGNLSMSGTMQMKLFSLTNTGKLLVGGSAFLDGTVVVSLESGYTPVATNKFKLIDTAGVITGTPTFDFTQATLPTGLFWNTSAFAATGNIEVTATPEPGTAMLAMLAGMPLLFRRRRCA